jgi:hypothetical protein
MQSKSFWATFSDKKLRISFNEEWVSIHFGAIFFSQTHLVASMAGG